MKKLTSYRYRLRHVILVAVLATVGAAMLVGGAASSAWAGAFNCESRGKGKTCLTLSGPNEDMEEGEGDNYTSPEFELIFWKYNGGSSYSNIYDHIFYSYTGYHCYSSVFDGHLEVASNLAYDNLAGDQIDGCRA
jgi:hypothetical protein